jgi:tRNA (guanine37-N1)-methyltransferase
MRFDVITIFPDLIADAVRHGVLGRAVEEGLVEVCVTDLRDFCDDRHRQVDDTPYGGGPGMVMKPEPFFRAVRSLQADKSSPPHVVLLSPQGRVMTQRHATHLAQRERIVLLCPRYEGVDERVREALVDEEISIGDYVVSGGEFPALVVMDAVARLLEGVLGNQDSPQDESHSESLLEHPHYTRPALFETMAVPEVLTEGKHEDVRRWRRAESLRRTLARRPDLLTKAELTPEDWEILGEL